MRVDLVKIFNNSYGSHMQIGRFYPYFDTRNDDIKSLLCSLKKHVDPKNLINPGSLYF